MKKLLKHQLLIYFLICAATSTVAAFCGDFWSIPIFVVSVAYFIYAKRNIKYEIIESFPSPYNEEFVKFPASGYEWLYTCHLINIIYLVIGIIGLGALIL